VTAAWALRRMYFVECLWHALQIGGVFKSEFKCVNDLRFIEVLGHFDLSFEGANALRLLISLDVFNLILNALRTCVLLMSLGVLNRILHANELRFFFFSLLNDLWHLNSVPHNDLHFYCYWAFYLPRCIEQFCNDYWVLFSHWMLGDLHYYGTFYLPRCLERFCTDYWAFFFAPV
jgi:hypothetical protein